MNLRGKKILLISPEPWGTSQLSKHHYAMALARRNNEVWFLGPPGREHESTAEKIPGLHWLKDQFTYRGLRFLPPRLQNFLLRRSANSIMRHCKTHFDVVWSFDNSRHYLLDAFQAPTRIHHVVDIGMNFHLCRCARSANLALASNRSIFDELSACQANTHFLHHGYAPAEGGTSRLRSDNKKLIAAYAGNMLIPFFNWDLVTSLVHSHPEVEFYFIGSTGKGNLNRTDSSSARSRMDALRSLNNVHFTGEKSPAETQSMLSSADILLLAYDHVKFPKEVQNPHKVMTYLSTGKVILSHPMTAYPGNGILEMEKNTTAYLAKFNDICLHISAYNSEENKSRRIAFALEHTYERQIERVENLLKGKDE